MEDLKVITASNIINLRTAAGMTQAELGEKLGYSDKSVSKWERAEGIPDAYVIKNLSTIFGVTTDYILSEHDEWKAAVKKESAFHTKIATTIALAGIWTLALLIFVIMWILGSFWWGVFIMAIPASLITLLVLNSVWENGKNNYYIIASLVFSVIAAVYFLFYRRNWWPLFLLLVPAELIVFLSAHVKKKKSGENR